MKDMFTDLSPQIITGEMKYSFWNPQEQNLKFFILLLVKMLISSVKK